MNSSDYAAHIRGSDNAEQTVREHCENVSRIAGEYAEDFNMSALAKIAGILHDSGKLTFDFNEYIHSRGGFSRGEIDHSYSGARYITEFAGVGGIGEFTAALIGRVIISHHGLHDWINDEYMDYFVKRTSKNERFDEIKAGITDICGNDELKKLFGEAISEVKDLERKINGIALKCESRSKAGWFYLGMAERILLSALVDGDRTDTADFEAGESLGCTYEPYRVWENMQENIEIMCSGFRKLTDKISLARMDISDRCVEFAKKERGICRLVVPTGGGKTVASIRFAADYCRRYSKRRIFYIAPFMSILEQNSSVLRSIVGDENMFLEHHSDFAADISGREELAEYELKCERWDRPVIATTMVQFLNTLFLGKMSSVRRTHCLANSVIIIDEIQSIPLKCVNLFNLAMNFLSEVCKSTIVLCSATQPVLDESTNKKLLPLNMDKEDSMTGDYTEDFNAFKRTKIIPIITDIGYSTEQTADFCLEKFRENGNLLIIVNTKKIAADLYRRLSESSDGIEVRHLSTSMCPKHREDTLNEIRQLLKEEKPLICVTTQLIEAGVDISFRCVVRSLAGADNVAQAAGRCNRHCEYECSPVYVIKIKDEELGPLRQIETAQSITRRIIGANDKELTDISNMEQYFVLLYEEAGDKDHLSYPLDKGISLLDLLSDNKSRVEACERRSDVKCTAPQSFAEAGRRFEVIADNTCGVIVPYNDEARKIIEELAGAADLSQIMRLRRKAQRYTVSLYPGAYDKLFDSGRISELGNSEAFALINDADYNMDYGISEKNQESYIY